MSHRATIGALLAALVASLVYLWPADTKPAVYTPISGRHNTVLFLTDSSDSAQSHIASASALLEIRPDIQIYWCSFATPAIELHLRNISAAAQAKNAEAKPIIFHQFSTQGMTEILHQKYRLYDHITEYGLAGYSKMLPILEDMLMPWDTKEYFFLFQQTVSLIEDIDPALIVLDTLPRPFIDAARNANRLFAILSPKPLSDIMAYYQPRNAMFWKYPALMSGHEFPVPAHSTFPNIWMQIRFLASVTASTNISIAKPELEAMGIADPLNMYMQWDNIPLISGDLPEASLPLSYYPPSLTICGPMTLDSAPAEEQDKELVKWLDAAPSTMLVYLGGDFAYDKERTRDMGIAIYRIIQETDLQVLWHFEKEGDFFNVVFSMFLQNYIENGRLKVLQGQLEVDPISLVNSGKIDVWVHHGATEYFHQAIKSGVRQIIVPLWLDQYNVARLAEHLGVGIWPGKDTAPEWDAVTILDGFLKIARGKKADDMQRRADDLKEVASRYSGRACAAEQIAQMAGMGY